MSTFFQKIILSSLMFLGSIFGQQHTQILLGSNPVQPTNGSTYYLAGSGVTSSATSFTLTSFTIPQNGYKIQQADLGTIFYLTFEPGNNTRQEVISCTTDTQNTNGTATFSGCIRGLAPIPPYTASTTLQFSHAGGTQVIFGTAAQLFNQYPAKTNAETISGLWTFPSADATRPELGSDTDTAVANALVTFGQLSRQAVSGASNASETVKGIVELATSIEQASSTSAGSTGALLSTRALYATSSPVRGCDGTSVVGALCSVIAQNNGTINPVFQATSTGNTYNWGAAMVFTASTTFAANSSNKISFNGLSYFFPPGRAASSTALMENGSGGLSFETTRSEPFTYASTTGMSSTNNFATTTMITIPAGVLTASSTIQVVGHYTATTNGGGSVWLRDGTGATIAALTVASDLSSTSHGNFTFTVVGNNSISSQTSISSGEAVFSQTATTCGGAACSFVHDLYNAQTSSVNFANALTLNIVLNGGSGTLTLTAVTVIVNP